MIHKNEFVLESVFWKDLDRDTIESLMGTEVANMVGFDQRNPYHCYDLFTHTLITMEDCGNFISKTAAFFHDIGKPHVATEKDGRLVFYNHSLYSAIFAKDIMEKMGFEEFEIDYRNGDRERELEKPEEIRVICKNRGGGDTNHVPHGDYHKSGGDYRRDYQSAQSRAEFVVGNAVLLCPGARCRILKRVACILQRLFELKREL